VRKAFITAATALFLIFSLGCGSTPISVTQPEQPSPTPTPKAQNLLVADCSNSRVLIFSNPFHNGENAGVVLGQTGFTSAVQATSATGLNCPVGAVTDVQGNVWVSDWGGNRVLEYTQPIADGMAASLVIGQSSFTTNVQSAAADGLSSPHGMSFDKNGNLWLADSTNNRVVEFAAPFSSGMSARVVLGQAVQDACIASVSNLCYPTDLAFDSSGDLWIVDNNNNRVVEYTPPFTAGQPASLVLGQPDFNSKSLGSGSAGLNYPWGIAIDGAGHVWVSDGLNWRVLRFSPPFSNGQAADLVLGYPNFTTTVNNNPQSSISNPRGLAFDANGFLYVADDGNSRVMMFAPPFTNGMNATTVIGQPNFTSAGGSTTASGLNEPVGIHTSP
jgi:sugar lactone lactonase YvrE